MVSGETASPELISGCVVAKCGTFAGSKRQQRVFFQVLLLEIRRFGDVVRFTGETGRLVGHFGRRRWWEEEAEEEDRSG